MQKCLLETSGNLYGYSCSLLWKHGRPSKKKPVCQPQSAQFWIGLGRKWCTRDKFNNLFVFLDINECVLHPNICGTAICRNTLGKYECECAEGYTYNSTSKNCEGRPFSSPAPWLFSFFSPLLYQTLASHLVVYLLIFILFITIWLNCLFFRSFRQAILHVVYTVAMTYSQTLEGFTRVFCSLPDNFFSSWELSCPTVERTFCPSSQTS